MKNKILLLLLLTLTIISCEKNILLIIVQE